MRRRASFARGSFSVTAASQNFRRAWCPAGHFAWRLILIAFARVAAKQCIIHAMRVGSYISGEATKHRADGVARMLGLIFEEDVIFIGEHDEKVPLRTRLPFSIRQARRLNRNAGRICRQAERGLLRFLCAGIDDGPQARADMLCVATHRAVVDANATHREHVGDAVERQTIAIFHHEKMRDGRRRQHRSVALSVWAPSRTPSRRRRLPRPSFLFCRSRERRRCALDTRGGNRASTSLRSQFARPSPRAPGPKSRRAPPLTGGCANRVGLTRRFGRFVYAGSHLPSSVSTRISKYDWTV